MPAVTAMSLTAGDREEGGRARASVMASASLWLLVQWCASGLAWCMVLIMVRSPACVAWSSCSLLSLFGTGGRGGRLPVWKMITRVVASIGFPTILLPDIVTVVLMLLGYCVLVYAAGWTAAHEEGIRIGAACNNLPPDG